MPEYKAGDILNSPISLVNTNKQNNSKYNPNDILEINTPVQNKTLMQNAMVGLAQSSIYGDSEQFNVPTLQDDERWKNYNKALNQNILEQAGNFLNQAVVGEIVGGTIQGFGGLVGIFDSLGKDRQDFNNIITDIGKGIQEWTQEVTPIYKENPYTSFDITDSGWWFGNGVSVVSSLSMLIPARGVMAGVSGLGKLVNAEKAILNLSKGLNKVKNLDKLDDIGEVLVKGEQIFSNKLKYLANVGGTAALMRHMENFREAGQVSLTTKEEALSLFNELDDTQFNKWQRENEDTIKEYKQDTKNTEITKEDLADYIGSKAGWKTYNSNWSNIVFDIVQVAPLFKGLKATTRGAGQGLRVATSEAEALGKTLTKSQKLAARLQPLGNVLKTQWTEGIEEMINGISEKEGMRLGRLLMGKEKDTNDFTDRLFEDYLQDPHIWEQGFWGVLGGVTFQSLSTTIQDKITKLRDTNYQSSKDKIENEIVNRKIITSNFLASKKAIENGKNPYKPTDKERTNYEAFEGTEEEIELQKKETYNNLIKDIGTELGLSSSKAGNVESLLKYLDSDVVLDSFIKDSNVTKEKAKQLTTELKKQILSTEKAYIKAFNSLSFTNLPQYIQNIVIPMNIRDNNNIDKLQKTKIKLEEQITNTLINNAFYENLDAETKTNINNFISSIASKEIKKAILKQIEEEKNTELKELYQASYDKISSKLEEEIAKDTTLNMNTFNTYGIDKSIIDNFAEKLVIDYNSEQIKKSINDRTFTNKIENNLNKLKEQKLKDVEKSYNDLYKTINLNQDWELVEKQFKQLQETIDAQLPNKKGTKIDYKKDLETLKQKYENLKNGKTAPIQNLNVSLEQQQLMDLGVDFTDIKNQDLNNFLEMFLSDDLTIEDKIKHIEDNLIINIEHFDKTTQNNILAYFNNKVTLLRLYNINDATNTEVIENPKVQEINDNLLNPNSEENIEDATKFEDTTLDAQEENHINLFIQGMEGVNEKRNDSGAIVLDDKQTSTIENIFSLRIGEELSLKVDTNNEQYNASSNILNVPISINKNNENLKLYINKFSYLENELLMLNNLTELSNDKLEILLKNIKEENLIEFVKNLNTFVIKDININESHNGIEKVQKHFIKILSFNNEDSIDLKRVTILNWKSKILRDYKANYAIRDQIRKSDNLTQQVSVVKKTSGDLVISRNKEGKVIYNSYIDIFGKDAKIYNGKNGALVSSDGTSTFIGSKIIEGAIYVQITENGHTMPLLLQQNTIGGLTQNSNKNSEQVATYITNLILDLVDAIKKEDTELQKIIKGKIDVYTFANREKENNFNYFEWFGNSILFNTTKGKYKIVITDKNIYIKDRTDLSKNLNDDSTIFLENKESITSQKGINTLKSLIKDRSRNVLIKSLQRSFDEISENTYKPYTDEATNITYNSYQDYLIENEILITRYNHIVDSNGKHISYFTNKAENNSSNWKTSRPLIINVASTTKKVIKDKKLTLKNQVENSNTFTELQPILNLEEKYTFLYNLADSLGIKFSNTILKNKDKAKNARGGFLNNVVYLYDKFFTEGNDTNRQVTINHEILHGVISKSLENTSQNDKNVFYSKLKEFIEDLLQKTKTSEDLNSILNIKEKINNIEVDVFSEDSKDYIKRILDLLRDNLLTNTDITSTEEVITYAYSNPIFAKFLNNVQSNLSIDDFNQGLKEKTFWTKFKELLLDLVKNTIKIFNGKVDKLSELNKILDTYIEVFEENDSITEAIEGNRTNKIIKTQNNKKVKFEEITNQTISNEGQIASEKTIRDLAARMSDRIGIPFKFESDRSKEYKGKIENNIAYINLAYATLDTPIHEILGHPIIRALKENKTTLLSFNDWYRNKYGQDKSNWDNRLQEYEDYKNSQKTSNQLYQNLLKELETGRGKEVLDRIKRDYTKKDLNYIQKGQEVYLNNTLVTAFFNEKDAEDYIKEKSKYTLEEQQEEALVELLGLMVAEKLDKVKDGKLISLLKRLLKEMKAFIRSLINQKEVEIDKLPDNMTLGDLSDLLAYSNSKLILPGNEVIYTTPDNQQFKTYQEASNHISELAKSVEDVDLDNVNVDINKNPKTIKDVPTEFILSESPWGETKIKKDGERWILTDGTKDNYKITELSENEVLRYFNNYKKGNDLTTFIEKNKEYEQSKEIIEEWKKVNNIKYNPEEIYSRGQEFSSVVGAYSDFDVNLMMQNLLSHIEDNEKAGGKFAISAYTKPIDKQIGHLEGGGGKIKFKIYPQSQDILWAANTDVYSGSVWDASEKVNKDKKSELLGVSYTKYPSLSNVSSVQPNLADIVDNLEHHHNELGIVLTDNNFRLEYDEDIPHQTKKIIDSINSILDQKHGKLDKPEVTKQGVKEYIIRDSKTNEIKFRTVNSLLAKGYLKLNNKKVNSNTIIPNAKKIDSLKIEESFKGTYKPTQTKETLKEPIENIKSKFSSNFKEEYLNTLEVIEYNDYFDGMVIEGFTINNYGNSPILNELIIKEPIFNTEEEANNRIKELIIQAEKIYNDRKNNQKEYTEQALINTKVATLKELAKKYPRSLIRSEVVPINLTRRANRELGFEEMFGDELPFQKIPLSTYQNIRLSEKNNVSSQKISIIEEITLKEQSLTSSKIIEENYTEIIKNLIENKVIEKFCS